MKKLFSFMLLFATLLISQSVFVSCDKDDNDIFYAGESEYDYKPTVYTITSNWDFSKVSGLSSSEKAELEKEMNKIAVEETFDTRKDATAAFDAMIIEMQNDPDMGVLKGLVAKFYLKRKVDGATIKSATIEW